MALTMPTSRSWTSRRTWVPLWVRPMPMWRSWPAAGPDAHQLDPVVVSIRNRRTAGGGTYEGRQ
jgi:hypothetical protein